MEWKKVRFVSESLSIGLETLCLHSDMKQRVFILLWFYKHKCKQNVDKAEESKRPLFIFSSINDPVLLLCAVLFLCRKLNSQFWTVTNAL